MPQVFQVLKCYKCLVFQIHQTKKSNKFQCKMCGEKQSIKRHYGIGTGKDCRLHVQRLNSLRGEMEQTATQSNSDNEFEENKSDEKTIEVNDVSKNGIKRSKWSEFVDKEESTEDCAHEPMFLGDKEVILEMPQKKKPRKFIVKTKTLSNLESGLNTFNNTSSYKSESNWRENIIDDFETENIVKPTQKSQQEYSDTKVQYYEQVNIKHYNNPSISSKQKSPQRLQVLQTISASSKWAQFVNNEDEGRENENNDNDNDNEVEDITRNKSDFEHDFVTNTNNLFSLSDDSDLDKVLDF